MQGCRVLGGTGACTSGEVVEIHRGGSFRGVSRLGEIHGEGKRERRTRAGGCASSLHKQEGGGELAGGHAREVRR